MSLNVPDQTNLARLRAEGERQRIALAEALDAPHTMTMDELIVEAKRQREEAWQATLNLRTDIACIEACGQEVESRIAQLEQQIQEQGKQIQEYERAWQPIATTPGEQR